MTLATRPFATESAAEMAAPQASRMPTIVMLTNDRQKIDRRVLLEADSLEAAGWNVKIVGLPLDRGDREIEPRAIRIGAPAQSNAREARVLSLYSRIRRLILSHARLMHMARTFAWRFLVDQETFYSNLYEKTLSRLDADVFVAHDLPMLPAAAIAAKRYGAKLVYDSHELYSEQELSGWEKRRWREIEAKYIKNCDRVITINPAIAAEFQRRYGVKNVEVIYNAEQTAASSTNQKLFHEIFDLPEESKILLYQGSFSANRHIETLVAAMGCVKNPGLHLVVLGDGPLRGKLEKIVARQGLGRRVHFHAAVPQEQLLRYTASADAGVIPYQATCLNNYLCTPNKLFEFIAAGLPILASDLPEIRKMVDGNDIGLLGNMQTPKAFAAAIDEFFSDPARFDHWRARVKETRKTICWEQEGKKVVAIYDGLR